MASIFQVTAPCPLFAAQDGLSDVVTLAFQRATRDQTAAGELVLSFADVGTFLGELQPVPTGTARLIHGIVHEVAYRFFVDGNPDVQDGDRCTISAAQLEIVTTSRYGVEHAEIELKHMAR